MHLNPATPQPEFSRAVALDVIGPRPLERQIEATAAERAALALRFDLLALDRFEGRATLRRMPGSGTIRVQLGIEAEVVQRCVVTLGEVPGRIGESTVLYLAPQAATPREVVLDSMLGDDEPDDVEPLLGNEIDLGELMAQQLAVALNPWPRIAGVSLGDVWTTPPGEPEERPLAKLAAIRKKPS